MRTPGVKHHKNPSNIIITQNFIILRGSQLMWQRAFKLKRLKGLLLLIRSPLSRFFEELLRLNIVKSKKKYRGVVNRIDRCAMEILIFSDKSLSFKVKLYNENSRFRKRNYSLLKLFPSNVQKISKLLRPKNTNGRSNGLNGIFGGAKIVTIVEMVTKLDSKCTIIKISFSLFFTNFMKCTIGTIEISVSKIFWLEKGINYIFVLPS